MRHLENFLKSTRITTLTLILSGCAASGVFVKEDLVYAELQGSVAACQQTARGDQEKKTPNTSGTVTAGGFVGGFGTGLAQGITAGQVEGWYFQDCMEQRGYRKAQVSSDEWDRFKALKSEEEKVRFLNNIYHEVISGRRKTL
jgi:hypothetical protein